MGKDPVETMQNCFGDSCDIVPDEVCDAVFDGLKQILATREHSQRRDALAELMAPRMAGEGWRFCPCFPLLRTEGHARIYDLVHANLANHLAHKAARESAA
jgi:hypothetical protein